MRRLEPRAGGRTSGHSLLSDSVHRPVAGGRRLKGTSAARCSIGFRITNWISCGAGCAVYSTNLGPTPFMGWEGSQPPRNKEVLQTWDAIKALNRALVSAEEEESLQRCGKAVETALDTYALISRQSVALNSKSGASHLEDFDGALRLFKRLAELDFV